MFSDFLFFFFNYRYFLCHVSSGQDFESSLVSSFTQGYSEDASWTVYLSECPTGQDPSSKFTQIVNSLSPQVYMVEASVPSQGFFQVFNQRSALFQTLPRVFKSCYGVLGRLKVIVFSLGHSCVLRENGTWQLLPYSVGWNTGHRACFQPGRQDEAWYQHLEVQVSDDHLRSAPTAAFLNKIGQNCVGGVRKCHPRVEPATPSVGATAWVQPTVN